MIGTRRRMLGEGGRKLIGRQEKTREDYGE